MEWVLLWTWIAKCCSRKRVPWTLFCVGCLFSLLKPEGRSSLPYFIYTMVIFCFLVLLIHYDDFWYIVINKDPKMLMFLCFEVWVSAKTALFHHLVHLVCFCAACLHKPLLLLLHISWLKLQHQEVAYDLFLLTLDECYSFILLLNWTSLKMDR